MIAGMERAWCRAAARFGVPATVVLVDAGPYDPDIGEPATQETPVEVRAMTGDVKWSLIESGAAKAGDRFYQVRLSVLPRQPRPGDRVIAGGESWPVRTVRILGPVAEMVAGRA